MSQQKELNEHRPEETNQPDPEKQNKIERVPEGTLCLAGLLAKGSPRRISK
jgi:hypothetical protein